MSKTTATIERRALRAAVAPFEVRAGKDGTPSVIAGLAAVFYSMSPRWMDVAASRPTCVSGTSTS